jgi:hypothetical protein
VASGFKLVASDCKACVLTYNPVPASEIGTYKPRHSTLHLIAFIYLSSRTPERASLMAELKPSTSTLSDYVQLARMQLWPVGSILVFWPVGT